MNFPEKSLLSRNATVSAVSGSAVGTLINWLGTLDNIPEGCMLADGSTLDITTYNELYNIIGYRATNISNVNISQAKTGTIWSTTPIGTPIAYDYYNGVTNGGTTGKYILPYYGTPNKFIPFHANNDPVRNASSWGSVEGVGVPYDTTLHDFKWALGRPLSVKTNNNVFISKNVNTFPAGVKYLRNVANLGAFPEGNYNFSFQTGFWSTTGGLPAGSVSIIVIRDDNTEEVVKTITDGSYVEATDVNYDNSQTILRNTTLQTFAFDAFITGAFKGVYFRVNRRHQNETTAYNITLAGCSCKNIDEKIPVVFGILTNLVSASSTLYTVTLGYDYGVYTKPAHGYTIGSNMYINNNASGYTYTPPTADICSDVDHAAIAKVLDGNKILMDVSKTSNEFTTFRIPDLVTNRRFVRYDSTSLILEATAAPDITGYFGPMDDGTNSVGGAFRRTGSGSYDAVSDNNGSISWDGNNGVPHGGINFYASRSSSVYQTGVTEVRPVNMSAIPIIKYIP